MHPQGGTFWERYFGLLGICLVGSGWFLIDSSNRQNCSKTVEITTKAVRKHSGTSRPNLFSHSLPCYSLIYVPRLSPTRDAPFFLLPTVGTPSAAMAGAHSRRRHRSALSPAVHKRDYLRLKERKMVHPELLVGGMRGRKRFQNGLG